jgi:hypothetical protein
MTMVMLGSFGIAKAQSITIDAPSSVYTNALVSISINTNCAVSSVNWDLQGGTLVNSYNNGATINVRFSSASNYYIQATAIISCSPNYQQQLLSTGANIDVYSVPPPPASVTVSGKVTQCNNLAVAYADITGAKDIYGNSISITTDVNGNYAFETALGTSLSLSASQSNRNFTTVNLPYINTNKVANISKIINYSVPTITKNTITCQTGGGGSSANTCTQYSGFVVGESYYSRYRNINGVVHFLQVS